MRRLATITGLALIGCAGVGDLASSTPRESRPPSSEASVSPTVPALPRTPALDPSMVVLASVLPTGRPTSTPPPAPTEPPAESPFERVDDFLRPGEVIGSIAATSTGYVAVGWKNVNDVTSEGRVWTSEDGQNWVAQHTEIPNGYLEEVVEFNGDLYAFGHRLDDATGIGPGTVWSSTGGISWAAGAVLTEARGHWMDVIPLEDRLIAVSASAVSGTRTWLSSDGFQWRQVEDAPPERWYGEALGSTVVLAGNVYGTHVGLAAKVSIDAGETWADVTTDLDYEMQPALAAGRDVILVATSACCSLPGVRVGIALTTRDGFNWVAGEPQASTWDAAVALTGGFLVLSNDGSTALSTDGRTWFDGPRMSSPDRGGRFLGLAAAGATGVLVTSSEYRNVREYDVRLWFAPIEAFEQSEWTGPVVSATRPEIGVTYPASVDFCPYSIRMDGQVWVPKSGDSLEQYAISDENATVTLIEPGHAIYTSDDGEPIALEPIHPVPSDDDPGC